MTFNQKFDIIHASRSKRVASHAQKMKSEVQKKNSILKQGIKNAQKVLQESTKADDAIQKITSAVLKAGGTRNHAKGELNRASLYLIGLLQGKTKYQSALDAGYEKGSAVTPKSSIEGSQQFQNAKEAFALEMTRQGITIETITGALKEMMERRNSTFFYGKERKGEQIDATSAGMAIDRITRILGLNAPEKKTIVVADLRDVTELSEQELDDKLRTMIISES